MIVIGDGYTQENSYAVAVTAGTGELQSELTARALPAGFAEILAWAQGLDVERV